MLTHIRPKSCTTCQNWISEYCKCQTPQNLFVTFPHQKTLLFGLTFLFKFLLQWTTFYIWKKIRPTLENFLPNILQIM